MLNDEIVVNVIGAGLAGSEASLYLSKQGVKVNLFDMKPKSMTPAHKNECFAEIVCSNSFKSKLPTTASGMLKGELEIMGSRLLEIAKQNAVDAGGALAVDREKFAQTVTDILKNDKNISIIQKNVTTLDPKIPTIIATGPLTSKDLMQEIERISNVKSSFFFDAKAPIIAADSIDMNCAFWGNRYDKGETDGDYLNCPMNKEEYEEFLHALTSAETIELKEFEKQGKVFEGCMPVEVMAKRGADSLRFGPLKPVGLDDPRTGKRAYAVLQLRKENREGTMLNMVGFQTNLKFGEQKRVFGLIPALKNAEFLQYGVMHRNSYVLAPLVLNEFLQLKNAPNIFIGGQLSGVEGYVESIASGLLAAINILKYIKGEKMVKLPQTTCLGGIINYITSYEGNNFQPMNANFGVISCEQKLPRDKAEARKIMFDISMNDMRNIF